MASSFPEILEDLEKRLGAFTISNGAGITVEGNFDRGFAVNIRKAFADGSGGTPPVTPTGACCIDGDCSITTEVFCNLAGGDYQGDDTVCDPNPCPQPPPTGACCVGESCSIETEDDCTGMGGTYQGDDTTCDPNPCPSEECLCGWDGFLGTGNRYLTRTSTFTYSDTKSAPFDSCTASWTHVTVETYNPITCEITVACSGGGSVDFDGDVTTWNWEPDGIGGCHCVTTSGTGICTPCGFNDCDHCEGASVISDTEEQYTCHFAITGFVSDADCTTVLSNQCIPI